MNVAVIHPDSPWILTIIAKKMCAAMPDTFYPIPISAVQTWSDKDAHCYDAFVYVDVQSCFIPGLKKAVPEAKHISLLMHLDRDSDECLRPYWLESDGMIFMCERMQWRFINRKWMLPEQTILLRPGEVSNIPLEPIRLGVVQRGNAIGKGKEFLPAVLDSILPRFKQHIILSICGSDWLSETPTYFSDSKWHDITCWVLPEHLYKIMPSLYDYLLIPSLWEGGPLAVLEALAAGKPIIAPPVGWVRDLLYGLPDGSWLCYETGDVKGCARIIENLVDDRLQRRAVVKDMSYKKYAQGVLKFIQDLPVER